MKKIKKSALKKSKFAVNRILSQSHGMLEANKSFSNLMLAYISYMLTATVPGSLDVKTFWKIFGVLHNFVALCFPT